MNQLQFLRELAAIKTYRQLQEAMTRNEFSAFMAKGLKGLIIDGYRNALQETTFQELVVDDTSTSDKEDYPSMGQIEYPRQVLEGEPFKTLGGGAPDNVGVTNLEYGGILEITDVAASDDQTPGKVLMKQAQDLGPNHLRNKDKLAYAIITGNASSYDGQNFFSANHPGYNGGATRPNNDNIYTGVTLTANALATVIGITALWEGADEDQDLDVKVTKIVVPVRLQQTAIGLTQAGLLPYAYAAGPLGPAAANGNMPNAMKGKMGVVSSYRLDKVSTTDWYGWTDFPGLLHQQREALTVLQEAANAGKSFENKIMRWRSDERFRFKLINWRTGIRVS